MASSLPEVVPSSSWEIRPGEIEICKKEDGSDDEIGSGGFGKVRKLRQCILSAAACLHTIGRLLSSVFHCQACVCAAFC